MTDAPAPKARKIGPYVVQRELGRGGMGTVYLVDDPALGRPAALKVLNPGELDEEGLERFRREAEAMAGVRHRSLVRIHKVGQAREGSYLLMEVVEGQPLHALRELLPPARAGELVRDLCGAVEALHRAGILHRDLKPGNVLLRADGVPVLLDLGLARLVDADTLTRTGAVLGTIGYMSPEQARGVSPKLLGPTTDVYGLGVILYELLTGRPPFPSLAEAARAIATLDPPWPRDLRPEVPAALDRVVRRAMAKDPAARPQSAAALQDELELALDERPPRTNPWPLLLVVGAAFVLVLAVVFRPGAGRPDAVVEAAPAPSSGPTPEVAPPTATPTAKAVVWPAWFERVAPDRRPPTPLPDGLDVADERGEYVWRRDGSRLVWIPPGERTNGQPEGAVLQLTGGEIGQQAEGEVRVRVRLTRGVFMGKHELDLGRYARFCEDTGRPPPRRFYDVLVTPDASGMGRDRAQGRGPPFVAGDDHPATWLTWHDARAYCDWAGLRLPTEAEWERAARGQDARAYPWGDEQPEGDRANRLGDADGWTYTAPVGSFPDGASPYGCLDMAGNAYEWVEDVHAPYPAMPLVDPTGPPEGAQRIVRGGGWAIHLPQGLSSYYREPARPDERDIEYGFRVALSPR